MDLHNRYASPSPPRLACPGQALGGPILFFCASVGCKRPVDKHPPANPRSADCAPVRMAFSGSLPYSSLDVVICIKGLTRHPSYIALCSICGRIDTGRQFSQRSDPSEMTTLRCYWSRYSVLHKCSGSLAVWTFMLHSVPNR
jgi:hypothetical protein